MPMWKAQHSEKLHEGSYRVMMLFRLLITRFGGTNNVITASKSIVNFKCFSPLSCTVKTGQDWQEKKIYWELHNIENLTFETQILKKNQGLITESGVRCNEIRKIVSKTEFMQIYEAQNKKKISPTGATTELLQRLKSLFCALFMW